MERVLGIGGVFFRAKDPKGLSQWYRDTLGINLAPTDMEMEPWTAEGGVTVFAPFAADTDYFPKDRQVMINFRGADITAMIAQLKASGVEVFNEQSMDGLGRFAHFLDPEGNAVELWEPVRG